MTLLDWNVCQLTYNHCQEVNRSHACIITTPFTTARNEVQKNIIIKVKRHFKGYFCRWNPRILCGPCIGQMKDVESFCIRALLVSPYLRKWTWVDHNRILGIELALACNWDSCGEMLVTRATTASCDLHVERFLALTSIAS